MKHATAGQPVTILYLNPSGIIGGAERSLLGLLKKLDRDKYAPFVVSPTHGPFVKEVKASGIPCSIIPFSRRMLEISRRKRSLPLLSLLIAPWDIVRYVYSIVRICKEHHVSIIHTNGFKMHFISTLVRLLYKHKLIWHVRNLFSGKWPERLLLFLSRYVPDMIITNSEAVAAVFHDRDKLRVIYNGVDIDEYEPLRHSSSDLWRRLGLKGDILALGTVSHFAPLKGLDVLIDAFARLRSIHNNVCLFIAGDEVYPGCTGIKDQLQTSIKEKGLEKNVRLLGYRDDIPQLMTCFDIYVLASWSEGFGRTIVEAMAASKPVVATRTGGIPEVVTDGITGILVAPGEQEELARAFDTLIRNKELRLHMGEHGLKKMKQLFLIDEHVKKIAALYDTLV